MPFSLIHDLSFVLSPDIRNAQTYPVIAKVSMFVHFMSVGNEPMNIYSNDTPALLPPPIMDTHVLPGFNDNFSPFSV